MEIRLEFEKVEHLVKAVELLNQDIGSSGQIS